MTAPNEGVVRASSEPEELAPILVWHERAAEYRSALLKLLPGMPIQTHAGVGRLRRPSDAATLLAWKLPPGALRLLPRLRWVQSTGAGVDHFLSRSDLGDDVCLTRSTGRFGIQIAEYVIGFLLHSLVGIEDYRRDQDRGVWTPRPRPLLCDLQVGIIGLGNIGGTIAARLDSFGARVVGVCRRARPVAHVGRVFSSDDWRAMLPLCDALILAAPLTDHTRRMIDADALASLPTGATLINVARGDLVEEQALVAALRDGHLGAAMLDAFEHEPLPASSPLWTEPRAWVTPHIGAPSEIDPIADEFTANYRRFISGEPLHNQVERDQGY